MLVGEYRYVMSYDYKKDENGKKIERRRYINKKKRNKRVLSILIVLISFTIMVILIRGPLKNMLISFLIEVEPVKYSVLEDVFDTEFIVIREEKVVTTTSTGEFELIRKEGERVSKNAVVGYFINQQGTSLENKVKQAIKAPGAGIVSYNIDGYESFCDPQKWQQLDTKTLAKVFDRVERKDQGKDIDNRIYMAGDSLFKITNNLVPSFLFLETDNEFPTEFDKGKKIELRFNKDHKLLVRGSIVDIYIDDGKTKVLFQVPTFTGLEKSRFLKGCIVLKRYNGCVLPIKAIVNKEDKKGVYLLNKNHVIWHEVLISGMVLDKVCVEGLKQGKWVIKNPEYVEEGQKVYMIK